MQLQPQEIEVWYLLPAIRRELCRELVARGLSQRETAKLLGLTEASVSHYFNSRRAAKVKLGATFISRIREVSKQVAMKKLTAYVAIQLLAAEFKRKGGLCYIHRSMEKVPPGCARRLGEVCCE
jgi:predicted transcriptional regulator